MVSVPQKSSYAQQVPSTSNVIERDGIYVAYANGIVKNTKTGLEWKAGPDKDRTWYEAKSWVEGLDLDGGGWRMPTMDELKKVLNLKFGPASIHKPPLLKITGINLWSGETKGSSRAGFFSHAGGDEYWVSRGLSGSTRALAVRSRSSGRLFGASNRDISPHQSEESDY